jgi:6-pyruvoyltetrahydropterin/6-carboxytetrahydropterin synthase
LPRTSRSKSRPGPIVFITRRVEFAAAHRLENPRLSDRQNARLYGPCSHKGGHGHNYVLEVTLRGAVDPETGMLIDLKLLKAVMEREVVRKCDHRNLNQDPDFLRGVIPTAENVAIGCWGVLERRLPRGLLHRVRLYESPRNYVDYFGSHALPLARNGTPP